jgi:hypothetical protein
LCLLLCLQLCSLLARGFFVRRLGLVELGLEIAATVARVWLGHTDSGDVIASRGVCHARHKSRIVQQDLGCRLGAFFREVPSDWCERFDSAPRNNDFRDNPGDITAHGGRRFLYRFLGRAVL